MNNRLIFRLVAFALVFYFFTAFLIFDTYADQIEGGTWSGGFRFLTNWGICLNLIVAICALINERDSEFTSYYIILPAVMVINVLIFLLYWLIRLVGGFGTQEGETISEVLIDYYAHFGTSVFLFYEVILYSKAFSNPSREASIFGFIFAAYLVWMEFFVQINNTAPCGLVSCGFPYEFLNDLDYIGRVIFYFVCLLLGIGSWIGCKKIVKGSGHSLF